HDSIRRLPNDAVAFRPFRPRRDKLRFRPARFTLAFTAAIDCRIAPILPRSTVVDQIQIAVGQFGNRRRMLILPGYLGTENALSGDSRMIRKGRTRKYQ